MKAKAQAKYNLEYVESKRMVQMLLGKEIRTFSQTSGETQTKITVGVTMALQTNKIQTIPSE